MHVRVLCLRMLVTITTERRGNVVYILSYFGGRNFVLATFRPVIHKLSETFFRPSFSESSNCFYLTAKIYVNNSRHTFSDE
jgi:hypothetical protein